MAEIGEVVEVDGEIAIVKLERVEACAKCKACTVGMQSQEMLLRGKKESDDIQIGDSVEIQLGADKMLTAVAVLYGMPLVGMIIGFAVGYLLGLSEVGMFIIGILFLFITYGIIKLSERNRNKNKYMPTIKKA